MVCFPVKLVSEYSQAATPDPYLSKPLEIKDLDSTLIAEGMTWIWTPEKIAPLVKENYFFSKLVKWANVNISLQRYSYSRIVMYFLKFV